MLAMRVSHADAVDNRTADVVGKARTYRVDPETARGI
jgi:hypothetical protein